MSAEKQSLSNLVVSRQEAEQKIQERIDKGQQLLDRQIRSEDELTKAKAEYTNWSKYNAALLSRLFDNSVIMNQYTAFYGTSFSMMATLADKIGYYNVSLKKVYGLESICKSLIC